MTTKHCPVEGCEEAHNVRTRLPREQLAYLRRLVGIPDDGPTETQRQQWRVDEAVEAT